MLYYASKASFSLSIRIILMIILSWTICLLQIPLWGIQKRYHDSRQHILQHIYANETMSDEGVELSDSSQSFQATKAFHLNEDLICLDKDITPKIMQRGSYWVFQNYIPAKRTFHCNETITYTTHGDATFLSNLQPLLKRWQGPVSMAIYAPGMDFNKAVKAIIYQRECLKSSLVKDYVTFHLFFDNKYFPPNHEEFLRTEDILNKTVSCETFNASDAFPVKESFFRNIHHLTYPVNVARNIARESANSYFIFPSDIELYPSPGLIPAFLHMIRKNDPILRSPRPKVFVNPIFEIEHNQTMPNSKTELLEMHSKKKAYLFHQQICSMCHKVPKFDEWLNDLNTTNMDVFTVGKRQNEFRKWEPIFIGTHTDPLYEERLTWDGRADKMTQGFLMCVLDYEFHVLNNAFLVHKPGIKSIQQARPNGNQSKIINAQNDLIERKIVPELRQIFGTKNGC